MMRLKTSRLAVIDVGSNSLRLVVYDRLARAPAIILNHKANCALGRGMRPGAVLPPDGVKEALGVLSRFAQIVRGMHIQHCDVLATAAVRMAADRRAFIQRVRAETGLRIQVLSGAEEATLGALGALSGMPALCGVVGDLGGGSLELAEIVGGQVRASASLPIGVYTLAEQAGGKMSVASELVRTHLDRAAWMPAALAEKDFVLVGGSWRALAKLHMKQNSYPLRVVQNYRVRMDDFLSFTQLIAKQSAKSLEKMDKDARKRADTLPWAALILHEILHRVRPRALVFSAYGLRDGHVFRLLPHEMRQADPLLAWATDYAERRFAPAEMTVLEEWTAPLFSNGFMGGESATQQRLRRASCLLSDHGWNDHPDYRAPHGFAHLLSLPTGGLDHSERCALGVTQFLRYQGDMDDRLLTPALRLLSADERKRAQALGLTLHLAYSLCGGALGLLAQTRLFWRADTLRLDLSAQTAGLYQNGVERHLQALAAFLNVPYAVSIAGRIR